MRRSFNVLVILGVLFSVGTSAAGTPAPSNAAADATALAVMARTGNHRIAKTLADVTVPGHAGLKEATAQLLGVKERRPGSNALMAGASVLRASAQRGDGRASAQAQAAGVSLFEQATGAPLISLQAVRGVANAACTSSGAATADSAGSFLTGLVLGGRTLQRTPDPNTVYRLGYTGDATTTADDMLLTVILNEQQSDSSRNGLIVTMIHVIGTAPGNPNVVLTDIAVARAGVSVFCGNPAAEASVGPLLGPRFTISSEVVSTASDPNGATDGSHAAAARGDSVTWRLTIANVGNAAGGLDSVRFTLPQGFVFQRSSGDLSDASTPQPDADGVSWDAQLAVAPGAGVEELITARVPADAASGTYLDDVSASTSASRYTQGLGGPLDVQTSAAAAREAGLVTDGRQPGVAPGAETAANGGLPGTGVTERPVPALALILGAAIVVLARRRAAATSEHPRRSFHPLGKLSSDR